MKQLLDFLPLVVFFTFYKIYDLYIATSALIIATGFAVIFAWIKYRKVEKMALITFLMVAVFGGLTVALRNSNFIIWKVTILYSLLALALLVSQFIFKKTLIQRLLGKEISLPENVWNTLNIIWALFFIVCGLTNLYVARNLPESSWVAFKSFGLTGATFVFMLISGVYIYRYLPKELPAHDSKQDQDK